MIDVGIMSVILLFTGKKSTQLSKRYGIRMKLRTGRKSWKLANITVEGGYPVA